MEYNIKLSQQDIQVIQQGLGELPLKFSASTFSKIHQQVQEQDTANAVPISQLTPGATEVTE